MSSDLDNLKMTYNRIYEVSLQIGQLIDRKLYSELVTFMNKKDQLLNEAGVLIEKLREKNEDVQSLTEICTKIQQQEQANIIALTSIRDEIKKELTKASKNTKLISAYSNTELKQGNILDYRQ
ncbi:MAG: hypothetical protein KHX03_00100 [Clostridium sp.]|nr:hypothetical protein [Clostridium sp.]